MVFALFFPFISWSLTRSCDGQTLGVKAEKEETVRRVEKESSRRSDPRARKDRDRVGIQVDKNGRRIGLVGSRR